MKRAILSDVHGNQVAFEAVLADVMRHKVQEVVCLGDIIGYGARPRRCVDLAMQCAWVLKGNHEAMLLDGELGKSVSPRAADAIAWTHRRLSDPGDAENPKRMAFLAGLPEKKVEGDVIYVHGSPHDPVHEYVKPTLGKTHPDKLQAIFEATRHVAFVGHTHIAGVTTEDMVFHLPADLGNEYEIGPGKAIINVGSVGQPRDRNSRACYVLYDGGTAVFRRVEYDVDLAASQIYAVSELDDGLGERLLEGR